MSTKRQRIIQLLEEFNFDGLIIHLMSSFAWATDGAVSYIETELKDGVGTLLITKESRHLIAENTVSIQIDGQTIERPKILVVK